MSEPPQRRPIKPINEMTPLELENYRAFLKDEAEKINARLKQILNERDQRNQKSTRSP